MKQEITQESPNSAIVVGGIKELGLIVSAWNRTLAIVAMLSGTRFLVRRLQSKFIIKNTDAKAFSVVVDVGCGKAPHRRYVSHQKYIGVDIEDRGGVADVVIADVNNGIPLPDCIADLVICTETLEHTKKPQHVVSEIFRITKSGGTVLLTAPMVWPVHEAPYDFYRYTNFGLQHLFSEAGFKDIRIEKSNGYLYSMCQLVQLHMRHIIFRPLVFVLNLLGFVIFKVEQNRNFPLGHHVVAVK